MQKKQSKISVLDALKNWSTAGRSKKALFALFALIQKASFPEKDQEEIIHALDRLLYPQEAQLWGTELYRTRKSLMENKHTVLAKTKNRTQKNSSLRYPTRKK